MTRRHRVLILGLDGATFDIIKPLVAQGKLPHLARLMREGTHGVLASPFPPITPTAWTSFMTGGTPGRHGIFDFEQAAWGSYDFRPVPANQHGHKTLWRIAGEQGRTAVVIDVPFTYPPEPIRGYMITGYGTPVAGAPSFTHPPDLEQELAAACGECRPAIPESLPNLTPDFFREWDRLLDNRDCINDYLLREVDWDLYMIVFGVTDNVQHVLWNYLEPLHPDYHSKEGADFRARLFHYYERVDASIGRMLAHVDEGTHIVVMSDHGFGSVRPGLFLPGLLMEWGMLKFRQSALAGVGERAMRFVLNLYRRSPRLRAMLNRMRTENKERLRSAMTKANLLPSMDQVDWSQTKVFATRFGVNLFVNRVGRFPHGIVRPGAEYEALLQELEERLLGLRDEALGTPVVKAVHRREALYRGEHTELGPDLVVEWANLYDPAQDGRDGVRVPGVVGNHVPEGVYILHGPGVRPGATLDAQITDIAPTVLYLMGLPVPSDMDGRVLLEALEPAYTQDHPVVAGEPAVVAGPVEGYSYSAEEQAQIEEQLRGLGYID